MMRTGMSRLWAVAVALVWLAGCAEEPADFDALRAQSVSRVRTDLTYFRDEQERYVLFRGANLGGNIKVPVVAGTSGDETPQTYYGHVGDQVAAAAAGELRPFSYVGRPFSLDKADAYFGQMAALGFNSVRLMWNWEAVYPDRKYKPDAEYLAYYDELIRLAGAHGIYVLINLHENLWSRVFHSLYSEWPVCQQCCRYDAGDRAIDPDGLVYDDIVCTDDRKAACCPPGDIMNQLWSLLPNRTRAELGIEEGDTPEERARKYRAGFSDRVSGDGAPLWATRVCVPEKNFSSPYWGVFKWLGTARQETGPVSKELFQTLRVALDLLSKGDEPTLPPDLAQTIEDMLDQMEPYLPPDAFGSADTYDGMPFKMWGLNNGLSLATNICFAAFYAGDDVFPQRRAVEYGDKDRMDEGVDIETFYSVEEAEARAAELRAEGYTHVQVQDLQLALQSGFRGAWQEIARVAKKHPHVIGYDILNEPAGVYILMSVVQAWLDLGSPKLVATLLDTLLVDDEGAPMKVLEATVGELVQRLLEENLELLPPDNSDETRKRLGLLGADLFATIGLNLDLDKNHLEPLYEYVGAGIAQVYAEGDPPQNHLSFWLEPAHGIDMLLGSSGGIGGQFDQYATTPDIPLPEGFVEAHGDPSFVWAPHWYPDIYPMIGFNQPSRTFGSDEYDFRDYRPAVVEKAEYANFAYDNVPFCMGEFGTYWNFRYLDFENDCQAMLDRCRKSVDGFLATDCDMSQAMCPPGHLQSRDRDYLISTQILDNYYEAYENLLHHNMIWVYTPDVHPKYGDWWDHEDFSVVEFIRKELEPERFEAVPATMPESYAVAVTKPEGVVVPRGHDAYVRPYPRAASGKPLHLHYHGPLHYFDPSKGQVNPEREFVFEMESKSTDAPTEIFVPEHPYPDGFYVWLSDGTATFDWERRVLYWTPTRDEPGWVHRVRLLPPLAGQVNEGWDYFFQAGRALDGDAHTL